LLRLQTDDDTRRRRAAKEADRRPQVAQLALEDAERLSNNGYPVVSSFITDSSRAEVPLAGQDLAHLLNDPRLILRQRELELEERRMKLDERRVKLEEERFEQQRQTAEKQLEMMAAQTNVLLKLAEKLASAPRLQ
jgi:putative cell wall-binding protein